MAETVAPEPWGQEAIAWLDALDEAAANGLEHMAPFIAADVVWEDRIGSILIQGEQNLLDSDPTYPVGAVLQVSDGNLGFFVSADEVLSQQLLPWDPPGLVSLQDGGRC